MIHKTIILPQSQKKQVKDGIHNFQKNKINEESDNTIQKESDLSKNSEKINEGKYVCSKSSDSN